MIFAQTLKKLQDGKTLSAGEVKGALEEVERSKTSAANSAATMRERMGEAKEEAIELAMTTGTFVALEFVDGASEKGLNVMGRDPRLLVGVGLEAVSLWGTIKGKSWAKYSRSAGRASILSGLGSMARGAGTKWRDERRKAAGKAEAEAAAAPTAEDNAAPRKPIAKGLIAQQPPAEVFMSPPGRRPAPPLPARHEPADAPLRARRVQPPLPR